MRAPIQWLNDIHNPTFVFEGSGQNTNLNELHKLQQATTNPLIHYHVLVGKSHFDTLAPVTKVLAQQILQDTGLTVNIELDDKFLE